MRYNKENRVFMVEKYHEFKNTTKVIEAWLLQFPDIPPPNASVIMYQVKKFNTHGIILDLPPIPTKITAKITAKLLPIKSMVLTSSIGQ